MNNELNEDKDKEQNLKNIKEEGSNTSKAMTKKSSNKSNKTNKNEVSDNIKIEPDVEMKEDNKENSDQNIQGKESSPIRNLQSPKQEKSSSKKEQKTENAKNDEDAKMQGDQTPKNGNIDMNCNEVLSDLDESGSDIIKTVLSSGNEPRRVMITGEKEYKPADMSKFKSDSRLEQNDYLLKKQEDVKNHELTTKKPPMSQFRKNYASLKRNLFSEFNSISPGEDNVKKDTVDEIANPAKAINELKSPQIKQEQKPSILDCVTPIKGEGLKYEGSLLNSMTPTPLKGNGYYDGKD